MLLLCVCAMLLFLCLRWPAQPVDVEGLGLTNYRAVIHKPMDLSTVKANLKANVYSLLSEFVADVRLIWQNCLTYNDPNSEVCDFATEMAEWFEARFTRTIAPLRVVPGARPADNIGLDHDVVVDPATAKKRPSATTVAAAASPSGGLKNDPICAGCESEGSLTHPRGALLCCDGPCRRSLHLPCVGLSNVPTAADWFCPDCTVEEHPCHACGVYGADGHTPPATATARGTTAVVRDFFIVDLS